MNFSRAVSKLTGVGRSCILQGILAYRLYIVNYEVMKLKLKRWKEWVIVLGLSVMAVRTGQNVWRLWKAGDRVSEARSVLAEAEVENKKLKARLEEVQSPEFVEKEAREKLGYGREGEVILMLPKQNEESSFAKATEDKPNWRKWWDLYVRI